MSWIKVGTGILLMTFLGACTGQVDVAEINVDEASKAQANCQGAACAACVLPWGGTLPGGETMSSVFTETLVQCGATCAENRAEIRCLLGKLQYRLPTQSDFQELGEQKIHRSCFQRRCDCDHYGTKVNDGQTLTFYDPQTVACGTSCKARALTCANGKMKDANTTAPDPTANVTYTSSLCNNTCANCTLPDGGELKHGTSTPRYKAATAIATMENSMAMRPSTQRRPVRIL